MESSGDPVFGSPPSDLIIDYSKDEIDRGAYGVVYAGKRADRAVAVKRIHKALLEEHLAQGQQVLRGFQAECQRMKDIGEHTNVVEFIGAFVDKDGPFLVMEKMSQNLHKFLEANRGTLKLQQQLRLCLDIATGLAFLHSQDPPLVHRDLTARNVLLDESRRAKIGDLGQSKLRTAAHFQTRQPGAVLYMPPEALRDQPQYTEKVDIFSFGVLMLEIATQTPPSCGFDSIDTKPEEERRSRDLNRLAENHPLKSRIRLCLKNEPGERPDAATLLEDLQKLAQASGVFAEAKKYFSGAIESLEENHHEVMQLAEKTASPELEDVKGLSTARVAEILKVVERSEMKVVFFGRTSNGKSTVINALLKSNVLPSGFGSTTEGICYIRGQSTASEGGFVKFDGSNERIPVESAQALESHMKEPRDIQIYWSTAQCSMLKGDIVLIDCPGMNAEDDVDDKVIECCSDADVFVYVANGTTTFETSERHMLAHVKERISTPSNTFILFNQWDRVVKTGEAKASKVKQQHLSKVTKIMVHDLHIFTQEAVADRTYFVSAKQVVKNADQNAGHCQQLEFSRFERMLQKCLLEAAITTKFGRHYSECQPIVASLMKAASGMNRRRTEEREEREKEVETKEKDLAEMNIGIQDFEQRYKERVEEAFKETNTMCDEFHSKAKKRLSEEVKDYKPEERFRPAKRDQYCELLKEHLQKKLREEEDCLQKRWNELATCTVRYLCEPLQQSKKHTRKSDEKKASSQLIVPDLTRTYITPTKCIVETAGGSAVGGGATAVVAVASQTAMGVALALECGTTISILAGLAAGGGAGLALVGAYAAYTMLSKTEEKVKEEVCDELIEFLNNQKDEMRSRYQAELGKCLKSCTDAAIKHAEEQEQTLNEVNELKGEKKRIHLWQEEAKPLIKKLEEMESQLQQFRETYLEM